jgi:hypothetical protein
MASSFYRLFQQRPGIGRVGANRYHTHPARPKTTHQNIVPDSPRVSWPKGIHATPSLQGIADAVNPPEPDDSSKQIAEKDLLHRAA